MPVSAYQYQLEICRRAPAQVLARPEITPDWTPACEMLIFSLLRQGGMNQPGDAPTIVIEPVWDEHNGQPYAAGFRLGCTVGGAPFARSFPITYFRAVAQKCATKLVEAGLLKQGDLFDYRLLATPKEETAKKPAFAIVTRDVPLPIQDGSLAEPMRQAVVFGGVDVETDYPVFIHWRVLQQASAAARRAAAMETGGVLLGTMHRDPGIPEIYMEITGQVTVPACGELTKLAFTPETWSALQAEVDRLGGDRFWAGWWHSHSFTKQPAAEEAKGGKKGKEEPALGRKVATAFLSAEDLQLHRQVFPRAHSVALLVTDAPTQNGMNWNLFGWNPDGAIASRAFHVLGMPMHQDFYREGVTHETRRKPPAT